MDKNPKIMLHYVKEGLQRGPGIQFDRMEKLPLLKHKYYFVHLNEDKIPREIGNIQVIRDLKRKIKNEKPDIIHISGVKEGFHCMIAAILAGCKKRILVTRGFAGFIKEQPLVKRILFMCIVEPVTLMLATEVQCNSHYSMDLKMVQIFAKKKSRHIYNIFPEIECYGNSMWREKLGIGIDEFIFVTVARITYDKGFSFLADAIKRVAYVRNIRFVVIGEGDYRQSFEDSLHKEINSGQVIMMGRLNNNDVLNVVAECDVFVLPTCAFETFGGAYLEAALVSVPSIGSNIGAVSEVIEDGVSGILIKPKNADELSNAILKLYNSPNEAKQMGQNALKRAKCLFAHEVIEKQIDQMYQDVLMK